MQKRADQIFIALVAVVLVLPITFQLLNVVSAQRAPDTARENRVAAALPTLGQHRSLRDYTAATERWMEDHFGLRATYINIYTEIKSALGLAGDDEVTIGQNGWLFLNHGDMLAQHQGFAVMRDAELSERVAVFSRMSSRARPAIFLFPPNKQRIYAEHLPLFVRQNDDARRMVFVSRGLKGLGHSVVDPEPALLAAKAAGHKVYHQTDTHWTSEGAYAAYLDLMAHLNANGVTAPIVQRDDLKKVLRAKPFVGDLSVLLGDDSYREERYSLRPKNPANTKSTKEEFSAREGMTWREVHTQKLPRAPTLLISGDSFVEELMPFLRQSFSKITVIRREPNYFYMSDIEDTDADIIIVEMVERLMQLEMVAHE